MTKLRTNSTAKLKEFIFLPSLFALWGIGDANAHLAHPVKPTLNRSLQEELNFQPNKSKRNPKSIDMPVIKFINRLKTIDQLIKLQATGNPKQLAEKLEISERQLFRYIDNLQELGATIEFDKIQNSYIYKTDVELLITYSSKK